MANLKVFVSSTCYDLNVIRSQIRDFIVNMGYEPIMSDYSDVPYDPRDHTHVSCVNEVEHCDMLIVIIGSRFGGTAIPVAKDLVNLENLRSVSRATKLFEEYNEISITQLEVLRAIELGIPIFPFIQSDVQHDHNLYEKNKDKEDIIKHIDFPSIQKAGTATYIFEFINFLRLRAKNNGIESFSKLDEIQNHLRKQWSGLFQRLLYEQKSNKVEESRFESLAGQMEDIKTAVMSSIQNPELKSVAQDAIKYRRLIGFLLIIANKNPTPLYLEISFEDLLHKVGLKEITDQYLESYAEYYKSITVKNIRRRPRSVLVMEDSRVYGTNIGKETLIADMKEDWDRFAEKNKTTKQALIESILSSDHIELPWLWRMGYLKEEDETEK